MDIIFFGSCVFNFGGPIPEGGFTKIPQFGLKWYTMNENNEKILYQKVSFFEPWNDNFCVHTIITWFKVYNGLNKFHFPLSAIDLNKQNRHNLLIIASRVMIYVSIPT